MSIESAPRSSSPAPSGLPEGQALKDNIRKRHRAGSLWRTIFLLSTFVGLVALGLLLYDVVNESMGLVAIEATIDPATLADRPLETLSEPELVAIIEDNLSRRQIRRLERQQPLAERPREELYQLVVEEIVEQEIIRSWSMTDSLFKRAEINAEVTEKYPSARLEFRSWLNRSFLTSPMSSIPELAGVRTAIIGTLWMIMITMLVALPIGIGAAIYLEEYASDNRLNRIIQTNINNLAGVPSIIYGMLGLAIFVRALEPITSGAQFGVESSNGRTVLSAALTMALLVMPIIIINAQEAIRAVPRSIRLASYGLGATKWQTIRDHVLPSALPGIMTGSILAISRALGETAPLIVVGASTFIVTDPDGPFSKFTTLTIQIYNWTSRPQELFRDLAAAAIIVLLVLLLSLNSFAVMLRNRFSRR